MSRWLGWMVFAVLCIQVTAQAGVEYIPWSEGKARQVLPFCPTERLRGSNDRDERCLQAMQLILPFDESFEQSKKAKEAKEKIVKSFLWLLSAQELQLPADGLILRQANLKIPLKYTCILAPQMEPQKCHFQPELEPNPYPTVNQRLFNYLLTTLRRITYEPEDYFLSSVVARAAFGHRVHIYPSFFDSDFFTRITYLFHETQHFAAGEIHGICISKSHFFGCDRGVFTGVYGAELVMAEIFLQAEFQRVSEYIYQQPFLPGRLLRNEYYPGEPKFRLILAVDCHVFRLLFSAPSLPEDLQDLCKEGFISKRKAAVFVHNHPEIFSVPLQVHSDSR